MTLHSRSRSSISTTSACSTRHGAHEAGDRALLTIVEAFSRELPPDVVFGRYGPDELLILAGRDEIHVLGAVLERVRAALVDHALQFETSERLPLTVSVGVCSFPEHGSSVTELLTTTALTLQEAKASGGDAIRYAGEQTESEPVSRTFRRLPGPDLRGRHQGSLHKAPLR